MKRLVDEFKAFILRGNVIELAVGVLMGTAFTAVVNAVSTNIFMPIINALGGDVEGKGWSIAIFGIPFGIGNLINAIINFLITAIIAFMIIKGYNKLQSLLIAPVVEVEEKSGPTTEALLTEILEELKNK